MIYPYFTIIGNFQKYLRYRSSFSQFKELCEITRDLKIPKLTIGEKKEIQKFYAKYTSFKINYKWHEFYSFINGFDKRYIPIDFLFNIVIPKLNRAKWSDGYVDKNRYSEIFKNVRQPKTFLKRINGDFYLNGEIITVAQAIDYANNIDDSIIKPSIETGQGKGVNIFRGGDIPKSEIIDYFNHVGLDFIIQERVKSHPIIAQLNPTSLNTIRMITYRRSNEVFVISATMKIGKAGELVDNGHNGGRFCGIRNGVLGDYLYSLSPFQQIPFSSQNTLTTAIEIPNYEKLVETAKSLALQLPYSRYAGWDLSIDESGEPLLIEANLSCPGGNIMQIPNGPLFGDLTEVILDDISRVNANGK